MPTQHSPTIFGSTAHKGLLEGVRFEVNLIYIERELPVYIISPPSAVLPFVNFIQLLLLESFGYPDICVWRMLEIRFKQFVPILLPYPFVKCLSIGDLQTQTFNRHLPKNISSNFISQFAFLSLILITLCITTIFKSELLSQRFSKNSTWRLPGIYFPLISSATQLINCQLLKFIILIFLCPSGINPRKVCTPVGVPLLSSQTVFTCWHPAWYLSFLLKLYQNTACDFEEWLL